MDLRELGKLDNILVAIAEKRSLLANPTYVDKKQEEEVLLQQLEKKLREKFGNFILEALQDVHDEFCPDNEVLPPLAYLAKKYIIKKKRGSQITYETDFNEGIPVESDDYPGEPARLVIVPRPPRILLQVGERLREEVWRAR
ncbi:MAG: hypothetical protein MI674_05965 [Cytophagales bacterium]|nr:hypothetical protein [Cytophagales bacterium]